MAIVLHICFIFVFVLYSSNVWKWVEILVLTHLQIYLICWHFALLYSTMLHLFFHKLKERPSTSKKGHNSCYCDTHFVEYTQLWN